MHRHFKTRCTGALVAAALIVGSLSSPAVLADQSLPTRAKKPYSDKAVYSVTNNAPWTLKRGEQALITVRAWYLGIYDVTYRPVKSVGLHVFCSNQRNELLGVLATNDIGRAIFVWTVPDDWPVGQTLIAGIACEPDPHYGAWTPVYITSE